MARQEYPQELRDLIFELGIAMVQLSYTRLRDKLEWRGHFLHEDTVRRIFLAERKRRGELPTFRERVRDTQRQRVYRFDNAIRALDPVPQLVPVRIVELIEYAHDAYGLSWTGEVSFIEDEETRNATWSAGRNVITIPTWARNRTVVAHEADHSIKDKIENAQAWTKRARAPHGPEMVRIMIELWELFDVVPVHDALSIAAEHRVKVSDEHRFRPISQQGLAAHAQIITTDSTAGEEQ